MTKVSRAFSTDYTRSPGTDPVGLRAGDYRVVRSGSWYPKTIFARVADRSRLDPSCREEFAFSLKGSCLLRTIPGSFDQKQRSRPAVRPVRGLAFGPKRVLPGGLELPTLGLAERGLPELVLHHLTGPNHHGTGQSSPCHCRHG